MALNLIATDVDLTLMIMDANGDYHPSTVQTFQYFIIAPDDFVADLMQKTADLLVAIYREHYRVFREREPNDVNYIDVVRLKPRLVPTSEYAEQPWLKGRCPHWENSNCIVVHDTGYQKTTANSFSTLLGVV